MSSQLVQLSTKHLAQQLTETVYCTSWLSLGCLQLGSTAIGVLTKEGVVLAVEKRITSPLLVSGLHRHVSRPLNACDMCLPPAARAIEQ